MNPTLLSSGVSCHRGRIAPRAALPIAVAVALAATLGAPAPAQALSPTVSYTLRDGPPPDGAADTLILPPDGNFGRVFQSTLFDAEHHVEFPLAGQAMTDDVNLALGIAASDIDLVYGESKTFDVSVYAGTGAAALSSFGAGTLVESIVLPVNGEWALDIDLTDAWNAAVQAGDAYLGVRIHDPVWTGTITGAGTIRFGSAVIEGVPEPSAPALGSASLVALVWLVRRSGRRSASHSHRLLPAPTRAAETPADIPFVPYHPPSCDCGSRVQ